jgi:7-cyano-7-deazaguanine synthase
MDKNAIILCSGGLDSVVTAHFVKKKWNYNHLIVLFFNYGQRSIFSERKASRECAKNLKAKFLEVNLKELGKLSDSLINNSKKVSKVHRKELKNSKKESLKYYVPCRNIIFLTYALSLSESLQLKNKEKWDIFTGFKCEGKEAYPDTTKEFVREINKLKQVASQVFGKIIAPLINKDKEDIILLGKNLGVNFKNTFSCYIGPKNHCGYCLACRLRQEGFYWANIKDPTDYTQKLKDFRSA